VQTGGLAAPDAHKRGFGAPLLACSYTRYLDIFSTNVDVSPQALAADPLNGVYFRLLTGKLEDWFRKMEAGGPLTDITILRGGSRAEYKWAERQSWFDRIVGLVLPAAAEKEGEGRSAEGEANAEKSV
ncbi:MAG: hypothetical protein Q9198_006415, partial [Flavoplaca austrocitrina]